MNKREDRNISWWNRHAKIYDKIWDSPWTKTLSIFIVEILREKNLHNILEIGCGTGLFTKELVENGYNVKASDSSYEMLQEAKAKNLSDKVVQKTASTFLYEENEAFDAIIAMNLLHVCNNIDEVIEIIINKISKNHATAVLTWPSDSLTIYSMFVLDRKYGRSIIDSIFASLLRWISGASGLVKKVRVNSHDKILTTVRNQIHINKQVIIESEELLENCQHILVIRWDNNGI